MAGRIGARAGTVSAMLLAVLGAGLLAPGPTGADLVLPSGFAARVYVTGQGFDGAAGRDGRGIPATSTLLVDRAGALYLARTGRRYFQAGASGEGDDLAPVYRVPPGGARLTPDTEARYFHGPPLSNPQVATIRGGRELFLTTFDRERRIGVLYRLLDGRIALVAGGTPEPGTPPLLRQPEAAAVDSGGNLYVADRDQGAIVRLDPGGRVLNQRWAQITRPRLLAMDARDWLWIGADGQAEAPWQQGPGEIWRVDPDGAARLVLRGPMASGIGLSQGGHLLVAERRAAEIFALLPDGRRVGFARFTEGDAPRSLSFAPDTPDTRRAGIAGDLFVVIIRRGAWPLNEILHVSGPFDDFVRQQAAATP